MCGLEFIFLPCKTAARSPQRKLQYKNNFCPYSFFIRSFTEIMRTKNIAFVLILLLVSKITFAQLAGFTLTGNPQSANGATWTFQDTVNNVWYDLQGILFEPSTGTPLYPAVIINHGTGGNVNEI